MTLTRTEGKKTDPLVVLLSDRVFENQSSGQSTDEEDVHPPDGNSRRSHRNRCRARPRSASVEACLTGMYRRCGAKQARRTENSKKRYCYTL